LKKPSSDPKRLLCFSSDQIKNPEGANLQEKTAFLKNLYATLTRQAFEKRNVDIKFRELARETLKSMGIESNNLNIDLPVNEDAIVDVPMQAFAVDGEIDRNLLKVGHHIPMLDQSGNRLNGIVVKFDDEFVTMDFNHPLAGNDLHFSGKVVEIREASADELEHGHVHSPESCSNCTDPDCHSKEH